MAGLSTVLVTDLGSIQTLEDAELRLSVVEKRCDTEASSIAFEAGLFFESQGKIGEHMSLK